MDEWCEYIKKCEDDADTVLGKVWTGSARGETAHHSPRPPSQHNAASVQLLTFEVKAEANSPAPKGGPQGTKGGSKSGGKAAGKPRKGGGDRIEDLERDVAVKVSGRDGGDAGGRRGGEEKPCTLVAERVPWRQPRPHWSSLASLIL